MNPLPRSTAKTPKQRLPIRVVCVVRTLADAGAEPVQVVKKFALEQGLLTETREYNSGRSTHDCDYITSLPAFHLYVNGTYKTTFYPTGRPLSIILDAKRELLLKAERAPRPSWRAMLGRFTAKMKSLFRKRTAMDWH